MLILAGRLEVLRGSALWARLGRVGLEWIPFANFPWPPLSQAFLSADDAVRYAHEQVGIRRDRQYAGYVFQRSDTRFVVTEPLEGDIDVLDQGRLYPRDNRGRTVFPDDHVVHARYVSHVALSRLEPVNVDFRQWTLQEALLSLQQDGSYIFRAERTGRYTLEFVDTVSGELVQVVYNVLPYLAFTSSQQPYIEF